MLASPRASTSREFSEFEDPHRLAEHLKSTQPERWAKFHASAPRIMVVDDNARTLQRTVAALKILYGYDVSGFNHPVPALRFARELDSANCPFQVLVTDLEMPEMTGMELTSQLGPQCPPTVWYTASSMNDAISGLTVQMNVYRAHNALALLDNHILESRPSGLPLAAIFVAQKTQSLAQLVNQVDLALLVKDQNPECGSLNAAFLDFYKPSLVTLTTTTRSVHGILEELRNATQSIEPIIHSLNEQGLLLNSWWLQNQDIVEGAIEKIKATTFHLIGSETTELAWADIHSLLGEFNNINPAGLEFEESEAGNQLVKTWQKTFYEYRGILAKLGSRFREYAQGGIDLEDSLKTKAESNGIYFSAYGLSKQENVPLLSDKSRRIDSLLQDLIRAFGERVKADGQGEKSYSAIDLVFVNEEDLLAEASEQSAIAKRIAAGNIFTVRFTHSSAESFDETFLSVSPKLAELRRENLIGWTQDFEKEWNSSTFILYIKASGQTINYEGYLESIKHLSDNPAEIVPELNGRTNVTIYKAGDTTCIGALPGVLDQMCIQGKTSSVLAMVYGLGEESYFASGNSHKEAAATIQLFIKLKGFEGVENLSTDKIYQDGTRITIATGNKIRAELGDPKLKSDLALSAIVKLGTLAGRVTITDDFGHRPGSSSLVESSGSLAFFEFQSAEFTRSMVQALESLTENELAAQTIDDYSSIVGGRYKIEEPSFVLRTRQGLNVEQQLELSLYLEKALSHFGLMVIDSPTESFGGFVSLNADFARKSGIFFYMPDGYGQRDEYSSCTFSDKLRPFVSRSDSKRLTRESIVSINGQTLPTGSIVFGAGDHTMSACRQQAGLSCALELALQRLKIPYDVCRAELSNFEAYKYFDGVVLKPIESRDLMFN